jgi:hypothetical protein
MNSTATYPPGFLAEYVGRQVIDTAILMGVFEILFIVLFFFARYKGRTINAIDAYLMIPAFLFCFSEVVISFSKLLHLLRGLLLSGFLLPILKISI